MGAVETPALSPVSSAVLDFSGAPYTGGGGGGGGGSVVGAPTVVQNGGTMGTQNFTGAQTYHTGTNFTVGNSVVVVTNHWQAGAVALSGVTIAGTAATLDHTGVGSSALLQFWRATIVNSGRDDVVVTPASGTGHYITLNAVEVSPALTSFDQFAEANATSAAPGTGVTTPLTTQCSELWMGAWRDDTGTVNAAGTPVPAPWTTGYLERDGVSTQGGASGFLLGQRIQGVNVVFACTSTGWYETTCSWKFALPVTLSGLLHQDWVADTAWHAPGTISVTPLTTDLLVTCGGWWDDTLPRPSHVATDSAGTFTLDYNPTITALDAPVVTQFAHQTSPTNVAHTVTPPVIGGNGDGYFAVLRIPGVVMASPIRDIGSTHAYHAPVTPPDPGGYTTLTVQTAGTAAKVGDIAVFQCVIDPNSISNTDAAFVVPAGWTVLVNQYNMTDNIGYLLCVAVVTVAGRISATVSWTDNATYVYDASIIVYATS